MALTAAVAAAASVIVSIGTTSKFGSAVFPLRLVFLSLPRTSSVGSDVVATIGSMLPEAAPLSIQPSTLH